MLPTVNSDVSTRYESKETNAKWSFIIKKMSFVQEYLSFFVAKIYDMNMRRWDDVRCGFDVLEFLGIV